MEASISILFTYFQYYINYFVYLKYVFVCVFKYLSIWKYFCTARIPINRNRFNRLYLLDIFFLHLTLGGSAVWSRSETIILQDTSPTGDVGDVSKILFTTSLLLLLICRNDLSWVFLVSKLLADRGIFKVGTASPFKLRAFVGQ